MYPIDIGLLDESMMTAPTAPLQHGD